jgi:prepilin-type N-terminal cleavage/methylation domain-containing protein
MKDRRENNTASGFSIIELLIAMIIMLVVMGLAMNLFSKSLSTRQRESSRADALTAAQAALNVISREIANSGYGLLNNGIVYGDSNKEKLHFLSNVKNNNGVVTDPGENITYFFEPNTKSILRYDANGILNANGTTSPQTSVIINRISNVEFQYFDYLNSTLTPPPAQPAPTYTPTVNTGRIRVKITVSLENVQGQIKDQSVVLISDVTLRNSDYMLQQY